MGCDGGCFSVKRTRGKAVRRYTCGGGWGPGRIPTPIEHMRVLFLGFVLVSDLHLASHFGCRVSRAMLHWHQGWSKALQPDDVIGIVLYCAHFSSRGQAAATLTCARTLLGRCPYPRPHPASRGDAAQLSPLKVVARHLLVMLACAFNVGTRLLGVCTRQHK